MVIKMTGVGVYAAFDDALDGVPATLQLQLAPPAPAPTTSFIGRERAADRSGEPGDIPATRERHAEYLRELGRATVHC